MLAGALIKRKGLDENSAAVETHRDYLERQFDILADAVRNNIDMTAVYSAMDSFAKGERTNDRADQAFGN